MINVAGINIFFGACVHARGCGRARTLRGKKKKINEIPLNVFQGLACAETTPEQSRSTE